MIQWQDEAVILSVRPHGESSAIVIVLSKERGRCAGLVRGAQSQNARGILQPGNLVKVNWSARLAEHLGVFKIELIKSNAVIFFDDALKLQGLGSLLAVCEQALPENEPITTIYNGLLILINQMVSQKEFIWIGSYIRWEIGFLEAAGFSLDLSRCAVTGTTEDLIYVSPKTGRAVSAEGGSNYRSRLLKLPSFLTPVGLIKSFEFSEGLRLTGYFLKRHVFAAHNKPCPKPRDRFEDSVRKKYFETDISDALD